MERSLQRWVRQVGIQPHGPRSSVGYRPDIRNGADSRLGGRFDTTGLDGTLVGSVVVFVVIGVTLGEVGDDLIGGAAFVDVAGNGGPVTGSRRGRGRGRLRSAKNSS